MTEILNQKQNMRKKKYDKYPAPKRENRKKIHKKKKKMFK